MPISWKFYCPVLNDRIRYWCYSSLSDNVQSLSERLIGPFDIEDVVDPIGVSISEGIMNFQNSGYEITGKVFQDCGTPRLQKRQASWWRGPHQILNIFLIWGTTRGQFSLLVNQWFGKGCLTGKRLFTGKFTEVIMRFLNPIHFSGGSIQPKFYNQNFIRLLDICWVICRQSLWLMT